jgi:hypothetical protein
MKNLPGPLAGAMPALAINTHESATCDPINLVRFVVFCGNIAFRYEGINVVSLTH